MSMLMKAAFGVVLLAGVAVLPAPATQIATPVKATVSAPAVPVQPSGVRTIQTSQRADALDNDCFVARKKSAKRKATNYVRLVKVCE